MPTGLFTLTQVNQAIRQGAWTGYIAPTWVEYLVVAGGGGGGGNGGSGGGAGGLLTGVVSVAAGIGTTVTVGGGGAGGGNPGANGSNSLFGAIAALGGGGGGYGANPSTAGASGGSGGGSTAYDGVFRPGAQGTAGQGNAGGDGVNTGAGQFSSGGGGGAGAAGFRAPTTTLGGNGGVGIASDISGTRTVYAGGGGGGGNSFPSNYGNGGAGGGGGASGVNGAANTGGGGGGGTGAGGSGIVIVRYPGTVQFFTGGTLSYANGYVIHTFYTSGTLAPTTPTPYVAADYQISRSLRFNSADSAYLNRTPASAGNQKTWTWSFWVKLCSSSIQRFVSASTGNYDDTIAIASDTIRFQLTDSSGAFVGQLITNQVFRDYSAWYHIVASWDTTQATSSNRMKLYINGSQVTSFSTATYPAQNTQSGAMNTAIAHYISSVTGTLRYFDGYMTEVNFIDGQALTPSSFGYYDFNTGVWTPMKYVGTYGTNGFYLNFSDNSNTTATTLGKDYSGNGNNWTPNNFSVSAGAGNDSLVDVPTAWGTDTGVGGTVRGNYATLNPLYYNSTGISNGNLDVVPAGGTRYATMSFTTGKWYWEVTPTASLSGAYLGVMDSTFIGTDGSWGTGTTATYVSDGTKYGIGGAGAYGASYTNNDVIGIALDLDAGTIVFYKNGVSQGTAFTSMTGREWRPMVYAGAGTYVCNFGQRPFAYTAPSGFKALNTQNLPTPTIGATTATQANKYFDVVLRNGGGSSGGTYSTTVNMANGALLWDKTRNGASDHFLVDSVRGVSKTLSPNTTGAEATYANWFTGFNSGSFTTGSSDWSTGLTVVDWIWAANGAGVTNTAGSITSTVSANTTSGFSVVTYSGNSTLGATVGHGLGAAPKMIIVKSRSGTTNWPVYHASIGNTKAIFLNLTNATDTDNYWNNTSPTSTVFSLNASTGLNSSGSNYVAYVFTEVAGYSKFGSYTGNNGVDGPFVYCGFRPAYVMIKCTTDGSGTSNWVIKDKLRAAQYNPQDGNLYSNLSAAEDTTSTVYIDFLSNGFKIRGNYAGINAVHTYIFAAFAEFPQKFSLAR